MSRYVLLFIYFFKSYWVEISLEADQQLHACYSSVYLLDEISKWSSQATWRVCSWIQSFIQNLGNESIVW